MGGLFFGRPEPGIFPTRHERLTHGIAEQVGLGLENIRLYQGTPEAEVRPRPEHRAVAKIVPGLHLSILRDSTERTRTEARQRLLAEASVILAASLDYEASLANLPQLAVPILADWCVVDIVEADGPTRRLPVAYADPAKEQPARQLQTYVPEPGQTYPHSQVLRTGASELASEVSGEWLTAAASDAEHLRLMQELGYRSSMTVALVGRRRMLGVLTFVASALGRRFTPNKVNPQLTPVLDPLRRYALESGKPVLNAEVSGETRAAPGERRHWLVSYYPVRAATGSLLGLGIVVTDITERQRVEERLRQTRDELERRVQERTADLVAANAQWRREIAERQQAEVQLCLQPETLHQREKLAAMGSLLASLAHELNNPLSIVVMQADLLREESENGPLTEHAKTITQAVERCMRIVRDFLTLARQHPPERRVVDLNGIMADALDLLAYGLRVDNIEVELRLAHDLPALLADPYQLQQVVVNLITNAHQALREVPAPRRLTLVTQGDRERACLRFEVADTGPGIPAALQDRIFEPFFTTRPLGVGTGLGLSLCRGIVEGHGGTIRVESRTGRGSVFSVELPMASGGITVLSPQKEDASPSTPTRPAKILVIDDEPGIATALAYVLSRSGHAVETAANGRLALTKLIERPFDLILCDLRMPELDGPGFYQELARHHPQLLPRIIFLTGDTLSSDARALWECVGVIRLHKPFRAAEVRRIVQQALQGL